MILLWSVGALIVLIGFAVFLGAVFFMPILELILNFIILYAVLLRSYVEIKREKKQNFYLGGAAASLVVFAFAGNFLSTLMVWHITTLILAAFVFAQAALAAHKYLPKYIKSAKHGKQKK